MPTEEWSDVKRREQDFEVVELNSFTAKNTTERGNNEDGINSAVESLKRLNVKSLSCGFISDESSLTCHTRSSNDVSRNVLKNVPVTENVIRRSCHDENYKVDDMKKSANHGNFEDESDGGGDDDWLVDEMVMSTSILSESNAPSFMLLNHNEQLMVDDADYFTELLNTDRDTKLKVVSIIGNTGEGKSHTMNETFCEGKHVFRTSSRQQAATIGCWAAFDPLHQALLLDTEGMLNNNQPIRLLLKVMAVSDVVIYRTRSERLHSDMFRFLGDACELLHTHFSSIHPLPSIVISHHTQHTELLAKGSREEAGVVLQRRFEDMSLACHHYPGIHYVASKSHCHHDTHDDPRDGSHGNSGGNYSELLLQVKQLLSNKQLSSARTPQEVFKTLKMLNDKFSGPLPPSPSSPHDFFTCRAVCLACQASCDQTMNHHKSPHHTISPCTPNKLLNNTLYLCKKCLSRGSRRVVQAPPTGIASYAWSGYSLECGHCGVVYRSRQNWFGGNPSEEEAVVMVVEHVWPGEHSIQQGSSIDSNMGQRVVDGVVGVSERLSAPCKYVCEWITHQINPPYWEPNHLIKTCRACDVEFSDVISIHHCRACGRGFCEACSLKSRPVPERGWGDVAVRVCDHCYNQPHHPSPSPHQAEGDVMVRRVGEVLGSTFGAVSSIFAYSFAALKEAARPDYWVPDDQATHCALCSRPFRHHSTPSIHDNHHHPISPNNHHPISPNNHHSSNNISDHCTNKNSVSTRIPISSSDLNITKNIKNNHYNGGGLNDNNNNSSSVSSGSNNQISSHQQSMHLKLHHCRSCGQGVCGDCSQQQMEVPARGWHHPVRVCDLCWQASNPSKP